MASLPFAEWNLRWNPFGEADPEDRRRIFVGEIEFPRAFLVAGTRHHEQASGTRGVRRGPGVCLQLLGPSGSGKTTTLLALREHFPDSVLVAWSPRGGWPPLPPISRNSLFVDDAQMADRRLLVRILRHPVVAVASQKDLSGLFLKAGTRVLTLPVSEGSGLTSLGMIVERRLEWARRGPGALPRVGETVLRELIRRHGTNLRAIQGDLYHRYQQLQVQK